MSTGLGGVRSLPTIKNKKMAKYIKRPEVIEAITFDEFVQFGIDNGGNLVNGMPWSFIYKELPVTHTNDECYLIPMFGVKRGGAFYEFTPADVLVTEQNGTYPMKKEVFEAMYQEIVDNQ